jgi:hypothetical protein
MIFKVADVSRIDMIFEERGCKFEFKKNSIITVALSFREPAAPSELFTDMIPGHYPCRPLEAKERHQAGGPSLSSISFPRFVKAKTVSLTTARF